MRAFASRSLTSALEVIAFDGAHVERADGREDVPLERGPVARDAAEATLLAPLAPALTVLRDRLSHGVWDDAESLRFLGDEAGAVASSGLVVARDARVEGDERALPAS